jgi:hypothetical protein
MTLHATLLNAEGNVLHDHRVKMELWPAYDGSLLAGKNVAVLGLPGERAWKLAEAYGASPTAWDLTSDATQSPDLLIVDSARMAHAVAEPLRRYLEAGGAMLGLPQENGETWPLGDKGVSIHRTKAHQFVSRKTGHPIVAGLDPFHFSFWYAQDLDRITHLVYGYLEGEGLTPITLTGVGIWYSQRKMLPAGAELSIGRGRAVLDQVVAAERMAGEPRAAAYMQRLLSHLAPARQEALR